MTCLSRLDVVGLVRLLQSGFPLNQCLELMETKDNKQAIEYLCQNLSMGYSVSEFMDQVLPLEIRSHFNSFLHFLSLQEALELSIKLNEYDMNTTHQLFKSLVGPVFMLSGCLIGIDLFTILAFPVLIDLMEGFNLELTWLKVTSVILNSTITVILVTVFALGAIILYFIQPKRKVLGYIILCKCHCAKMICHFVSTQFAVYFNECTRLGNSTQMTLSMLQKIDKKPLLVFIAYHVEQALLEGKTMEEAMGHLYLDTALRRYMEIAIHSSSLKEMLESYIAQNEEKGQLMCQTLSRRITAISYCSIGLLIILIYQILLLPLSIMGQI